MTSYLRVVELQGSSSFGVAIVNINWVNWILEINRRSLGRADHETNNTTEIKDGKNNTNWDQYINSQVFSVFTTIQNRHE